MGALLLKPREYIAPAVDLPMPGSDSSSINEQGREEE
jgi:hypothetical protein